MKHSTDLLKPKRRAKFTNLPSPVQKLLWDFHFSSMGALMWFAQHTGSVRDFEKLIKPLSDASDDKEFWIIVKEIWQATKNNQALFFKDEGVIKSGFAYHTQFGIQAGLISGSWVNKEIQTALYEIISDQLGFSYDDDSRHSERVFASMNASSEFLDFLVECIELDSTKCKDGKFYKYEIRLSPLLDAQLGKLRTSLNIIGTLNSLSLRRGKDEKSKKSYLLESLESSFRSGYRETGPTFSACLKYFVPLSERAGGFSKSEDFDQFPGGFDYDVWAKGLIKSELGLELV